MFDLFFKAVILGSGLAVGAIVAFGFFRIITDTVDLVSLSIRKKFGIPLISKYVFGSTYNDYQTLIINDSKWKVLPSPLAHVKLLTALDGTGRFVVLSEYTSEDYLTQAVEDSRQLKTGVNA